ncbi:MAG TPA: hypothetical protein VFO37_07815 [Chitinophagaceae bacterium]|nr:hypothetical protein [Chitinophagaceae bacterium]
MSTTLQPTLQSTRNYFLDVWDGFAATKPNQRSRNIESPYLFIFIVNHHSQPVITFLL